MKITLAIEAGERYYCESFTMYKNLCIALKPMGMNHQFRFVNFLNWDVKLIRPIPKSARQECSRKNHLNMMKARNIRYYAHSDADRGASAGTVLLQSAPYGVAVSAFRASNV